MACDDFMMPVTFTDGCVLGVPPAWFPRLRDATPEQHANHEISGGIGLYWEDIDEDLSIAGLMAGAGTKSA